jgi:hypothetical protein
VASPVSETERLRRIGFVEDPDKIMKLSKAAANAIDTGVKNDPRVTGVDGTRHAP